MLLFLACCVAVCTLFRVWWSLGFVLDLLIVVPPLNLKLLTLQRGDERNEVSVGQKGMWSIVIGIMRHFDKWMIAYIGATFV